MDFSEIHRLGSAGEESLPSIGYFYHCDTIEGLPLLLQAFEQKIQVIYLDPPFFTGQNFQFQQRIGESGWQGNMKSIIAHKAYSDQWDSKESFLFMLKEVLSYAHRLLKPEGSIFLHLDYRFSPYARILMDEIFGADNLLNEIIWSYKSGGRAKEHFSRKHDNILFYRKSKKHYFNIEEIGIKRGTEKRNNMKRQLDDDGRVFWSIKSNGKVYKYYEDGKIYPSDVWDDISHLQQKDPERTGYDTQKPEALLQRIIKAASQPGDWIGDFFAGSGTTLAVAQKTGRNWIGMDKSEFSLHTCRKRLLLSPANGNVHFYHPSNIMQDRSDKAILKAIKNEQQGINISILDYFCKRLEGVHNYLDYIDYWAVGTEVNGKFMPAQYSFRSLKKPSINSMLSIFCFIKGRIVVHIVDIFGEQSFIELMEVNLDNV